jgi:hypothetical protein
LLNRAKGRAICFLRGGVARVHGWLKKLNVGLTAWVTFRSDDDPGDSYDVDQIGYCKVKGTWGIALRKIWGNYSFGEHDSEGPWLFNDAPRELRLQGVDKIPELIEALFKEAFDTTKKVQEKTRQVRELTIVIEKIASTGGSTKGGK